jgi:hypothetical protein
MYTLNLAPKVLFLSKVARSHFGAAFYLLSNLARSHFDKIPERIIILYLL